MICYYDLWADLIDIFDCDNTTLFTFVCLHVVFNKQIYHHDQDAVAHDEMYVYCI